MRRPSLETAGLAALATVALVVVLVTWAARAWVDAPAPPGKPGFANDGTVTVWLPADPRFAVP